MARRGTGGWTTLALIAGVLSAPLLVFVAVFGLRFGWWGLEVALDLLSITVVPWLLGLGAICALILLWRARRTGAVGWLLGLAAVAMMAMGSWLYLASPGVRGDNSSPLDVATDTLEPPGFSPSLRRYHGTVDVEACEGVVSIPTQVRAEDASEALRRAGFTPLPSALFQVEGTHEGMWFLLRHDATIRIRPGQTDIRVAARNTRPNGGETCRLLQRVVAELQPRR
ncbi:DUF1499 domain-containing protein [Brevundimonas sp.]|uniref:DUF1499 domain-containing protein n=1 Tax=Brevundimonas sp. TaxID=1871086 RepID=UPI001DAFDCC5|nr:DUF1499 domain-containing protein [Brevundimonas sp.]MBL0947249.1 DUF1499 domain-containing protein [Brevundimonas sp.]